jgi:hypothetical protein
MKRSKHQRLFHKAFIGACIKKILGDDYGSVLEKVIQHYGIESTTSDVIITTPRRFGKTYGLAQFVSAFVLAMDSIEISIYSTGKRASTKLIEKIRDFVILIGGKDKIQRYSNNEILQVMGANGKSSFIGSYPSSVRFLLLITNFNQVAVRIYISSFFCVGWSGMYLIHLFVNYSPCFFNFLFLPEIPWIHNFVLCPTSNKTTFRNNL